MKYEENGYLVIREFFTDEEIKNLREILSRFHEEWSKENIQFYSEKAVNSAYLTGSHLIDSENKKNLFKLIASFKIKNILKQVIPENPMFMNTQLFFNPVNLNQKNYWHRDPQYHLNLEEQKGALKGPNVVHFRIPLFDEPGIEVIPGSHVNWDTEEELEVRLEKNGKKCSDDLSSGVSIPLSAGDLLVFSANMIHRGLYGMQRLSLDILFSDSVPEIAKFVESSCLPDISGIEKYDHPEVFLNAIKMKSPS